jgi:hypothetical protein
MKIASGMLHFSGAYWLHYQGDRPDDTGSKHLWNVGQFIPDYKT